MRALKREKEEQVLQQNIPATEKLTLHLEARTLSSMLYGVLRWIHCNACRHPAPNSPQNHIATSLWHICLVGQGKYEFVEATILGSGSGAGMELQVVLNLWLQLGLKFQL